MRRLTRLFCAPLSGLLLSSLTLSCQTGESKTAHDVLETSPPAGKIEKAAYGKVDDQEVSLFTLTNKNGLIAKITDYGALVTELHVPDKQGQLSDIVLGYEDVQKYVADSPYFGATIGRVGNRIRDAKFELEGKTYELAANNDPHHLHGGKKGWDKVVWEATPEESEAGPSLKLTYNSADGEEGYPGNVQASVIYTLTHDDELKVEMSATTDATTPINIVHHTYWNLAGNGHDTIRDHSLQLFADNYTPGDPLVPTGEIKPVAGTPMDFREPKLIGTDLEAAGGDPIGYDLNLVVNGNPDELRKVARVVHPGTGRVLELWADQPGVQFYSGNFMDGSTTGKGAEHKQYSGFCLESQKFPNAINVPEWKDSVIVKAGEQYSHTMVHKFLVEGE